MHAARARRRVPPDKQVVLDDTFIPTVLDARAARRLATFITELLGLLHQRGEALGGRVAATGRGALRGDRRLPDAAGDQPLRAAAGALRGLGRAASRGALSRLRGGGGRTGDVHHAVEAPAEAPRLSARSAARVVRAGDRGAARVAQRRAGADARFRFRSSRRSSASVWRRSPDRSLYTTAVFVLAARADVPAEDLRRRFPVAVQDRAGREDSRPRATCSCRACRCTPCRSRRDRFRITPASCTSSWIRATSCGTQLKSSGGVAMHVAGEFPGLAMEFWAIRG